MKADGLNGTSSLRARYPARKTRNDDLVTVSEAGEEPSSQ